MEVAGFQRPVLKMDHSSSWEMRSSSTDNDHSKSKKRGSSSRKSSSSREELGQKRARRSREEEAEGKKDPSAMAMEFRCSNSTLSNSSSSTTFVQADVSSFRDLVQRLTGAKEDSIKMPVSQATGQGRPIASNSVSSKRSSPPSRRNSSMVIKSLPTRRNLFLKNAMLLDLVSPKSPLSLALNSSPSSSASSSSSSSRQLDQGLFLPLESPRRQSDHTPDPELLPLFPMH